jgi:lipopolysaccharide/colanic/teichoic acid biosynthesis glycosyltransferase
MWYPFVKRVIDITGALVGLAIAVPLFLITAVVIKLSSPGPIFADIPERVGKDGVVFKMFKFRSMIKAAHSLLRSDSKFKKFYEQYKKNSFKIKTDHDPRITGVGRFLRKTSLDELPQLINILKGDMSLVGPRAFHTDEINEQQKRFPGTKTFVSKLLTVKPGMTGPWQVSGRSSVDFPDRVRLDAYYAENKSFLVDLKILLKTIPVIFKGEGN